MSVLVRFKKRLDGFLKATIYERASRRSKCAICGKMERDIILVRPNSPVEFKLKRDKAICHYCLVQLAFEMPIKIDDNGTVFGKYNPKDIAQAAQKRRRPKRKSGKKTKPGPKVGASKRKQTPTNNTKLLKNLIPGIEPVISEEPTDEPIQRRQAKRDDKQGEVLPETSSGTENGSPMCEGDGTVADETSPVCEI